MKFPEINRLLKIYDTPEKLEQYLNYISNLYQVIHKALNSNKYNEYSRIKQDFIKSALTRLYKKIEDILLIRAHNQLDQIIQLEEAEIAKSIRFVHDKFSGLFKLIPIITEYGNCIKTTGIHAAGMLIGHKNFLSKIPLYFGSNADQQRVLCTHYDMDMLSKMNAIKFDILGLDNLSIMAEFCKIVGLDYEEDKIFNIMLNDKLDVTQHVYTMLRQGAVKNVFQLEKFHIGRLCSRITLSTFEDVVALNSLNRPGTSGVTKEYINNKKLKQEVLKQKIDRPIYDATVETYGIIIYQEQIMQAVKNMANYTTSEADIFRAIISKKKKELLDAEKIKFIDRCIKNNVPDQRANELFAIIEKFAGYAFNKSHAVAYSKITALTAYLKYCNYIMYSIIGFIHKMDKTNNLQNMIEIIAEMLVSVNLWTKISHIYDRHDIAYMTSDINSRQFKYNYNAVKTFSLIRIKLPVYIVKGIAEHDAYELRDGLNPKTNLFDILLNSKITKAKLSLLNTANFFQSRLDADKLFHKIESIRNLTLKFKNNLYSIVQKDKISDFIIPDPDLKIRLAEEFEHIGFSLIRSNIATIIKKILAHAANMTSASVNTYAKPIIPLFIIFKAFDTSYNIIGLYNLSIQKTLTYYKSTLHIFDVIHYNTSDSVHNLTDMVIKNNDLKDILKMLNINYIGWEIKGKDGNRKIYSKYIPLSYIYYLFEHNFIDDINLIFNTHNIAKIKL